MNLSTTTSPVAQAAVRSKAVRLFVLYYNPRVCSMFCCTVFCVLSRFTIILMEKRECGRAG